MKYGIFGGTFDPFTAAHYEIVKKALSEKLVDKVIVIPTVVDYYRPDKRRMFTNEDRLKIINKWLDGCKDVVIDSYELELVRKSPGSCVSRRYFHMLQDIVMRYDYDCSSEFYTIVGGDSWNALSTWFSYEKLLAATKFIAVKRSGDEKLVEYELQDGTKHVPAAVIKLDGNLPKASASAVRERLQKQSILDGDMASKLDSYLLEVDKYLKCGYSAEDQMEIKKEIINGIKSFSQAPQADEDIAFEEAEKRLMKIAQCLMDPYKDSLTKYSIVEDIVKGKL